jgi:helicase
MDKKEIIEKALKAYNFERLNPIQSEAIKRGLFENNLIVAAPTASGKTLCAVLAGLNCYYNKKMKMIYLCPLIALAQEHYSSFKEKFEKIGIKIALSIGDYDSSDPWLRDYDWIVCSNEKADSLIRHGAEWIGEIGLIVVDEIHMLTDNSRGPTLEILLTRLKEIVPNAQIIGLSATISNAKEIAEWLKADFVFSEWRPVRLYEGVSFNHTIQFQGKRGYELDEKLWHELAIVDNSLKNKKQVLFFVSSRRNAESLAEKLSEEMKRYLAQNDLAMLSKISEDVLNVLEVPTKQCKRLAKCLKSGVAFHHAGLLGKQKKIIEDNFRKGYIKVIVATPTLAMGVNLPSHRVVIRDAKRFYSGYGARYIPVLEYKQMAGRAGRPEYNDEGEAILVAKSEEEAFELFERFVNAETEQIQSKLAVEPILRMHVLALIASGFIKDIPSLYEFFKKTFYAYQYGDITAIEIRIERILESLINFGFIVRINERLMPTKIGKRVSELYIDPVSGYKFVSRIKASNEIGYLQLISDTLEMRPLLAVKEGDIKRIEDVLMKNHDKILSEVPKEWDEEYDEFMQSLKTSLLFYDWISEASEDELMSKYGITPGELRTRLANAEWLCYALQELSLLLGKKEILKDLRKLRVRLKHGIKEELLPLIKLNGIGRVRARRLYSHNLRTLEDLRNVPISVLQKIIGTSIANSIKRQLGEVELLKEDKQSSLSSFRSDEQF